MFPRCLSLCFIIQMVMFFLSNFISNWIKYIQNSIDHYNFRYECFVFANKWKTWSIKQRFDDIGEGEYIFWCTVPKDSQHYAFMSTHYSEFRIIIIVCVFVSNISKRYIIVEQIIIYTHSLSASVLYECINQFFNTFVYLHNYVSKESSTWTMETSEKICLLLGHKRYSSKCTAFHSKYFRN